MHRLFVVLLFSQLFAASALGQGTNVILITADGLRWQEVFRGPDEQLLKDEKFTPKNYASFKSHQKIGVEQARKALMPFFWTTIAGRTVLLITTDHGRGEQPLENWQHHSSAQATRRQDPESNGIEGSEQLWLAAIGAGIKPQGLIVPKLEAQQAQTAATVLHALGIDYASFDRTAAPPLTELFK